MPTIKDRARELLADARTGWSDLEVQARLREEFPHRIVGLNYILRIRHERKGELKRELDDAARG